MRAGDWDRVPRAGGSESGRAKLRRRGLPLLAAAAIWFGWALVSFVLYHSLDALGLFFGLLLGTGLSLGGLLALHFRFQREIWRSRQTIVRQRERDLARHEELILLTGRISHRRPLPFPLQATGFEAILGLLNALWEHILEEQPRRALELGSGLSTLVMAYALDAGGGGGNYWLWKTIPITPGGRAPCWLNTGWMAWPACWTRPCAL